MANGITELTLEEIADLGISEKRKNKTSKGRKVVDTSTRNMDTWFQLPTTLGFCENEYCPDKRPRKIQEGNAMVATVNGKKMCRICYLNDWLL
jgi:hypothetical protein